MEKVALLKCLEYVPETIERVLLEGFQLLGGDRFLRTLIPPQCKVLLKPNLLVVERPGALPVTDYRFFEGVVRVLKHYTNQLSFGDSPGFGSSRAAAEKSGLMAVAERYGVTFKPFQEKARVKLEQAICCRSWDVAKDVIEADLVVTLPRLKTHALLYFTGALKNQYGCIIGEDKPEWHTRMPETDNFCRMLLDLNKVIHPGFAIMDGIIAMAGNGPKNGHPYPLHAILMGQSLSAVDSVAARLIGYRDPLSTPLLRAVEKYNWGPVRPDEVEILGKSLKEMEAKNFSLCRTEGEFSVISPKFTKLLQHIIAPSPALILEKCTGCGRCAEVCPENPKALWMTNRHNGKPTPEWMLGRCIRCFCCQELCPTGAVTIKTRWLGRMFKRGFQHWSKIPKLRWKKN